MALLNVSGIRKELGASFALRGISFDLQPFQKLAIIGETGSGKTMLLRIIAGTEQADSGTVLFNGVTVKGPLDKLMPGHKGIAYLSQHYTLRNHYRVEELLAMANDLPDETANDIYTVCRISHLVKRRTDQLSGGEKQRIALALLLITKPTLLILDEPFSNLDMIHKEVLKEVLQNIGSQLQITCILASHDPLDALPWADNIMVMRHGAVVQQGAPQNIYYQPVNEYVAGLMGKYNALSNGLLHSLGITYETGKKAIIRPEEIFINKTGAGVKGRVNAVLFYGSYCEALININGEKITARITDSHIHTGDDVCVSLSAGNVWYVS